MKPRNIVQKVFFYYLQKMLKKFLKDVKMTLIRCIQYM
ncbi:hypothetical protein CSCA_0606 [Clostridium scatologenes]|uniref:Uncharacterized protein n=1 Tax=Clostridium scatologenes TaxID=1548 RepID=A0A0E3GQ05_CLOSL|nr:hypothetical protein CSCA_0606 [Clostridium scatologenes]